VACNKLQWNEKRKEGGVVDGVKEKVKGAVELFKNFSIPGYH
jgi:hypothetical protein